MSKTEMHELIKGFLPRRKVGFVSDTVNVQT